MKHYLLPEQGAFYKANLHCHSNISDGKKSPEELKTMYREQGYSVLAYTDHELLVDHSDLDDKEFLTLTSLEYGIVEQDDYNLSKTIELNMFKKDQHDTLQVCFEPDCVFHGEKWRIPEVKSVCPDFKREYTIESIQQVIDTANENGFVR